MVAVREAWEFSESAATMVDLGGRSVLWGWLVCITAVAAAMVGAGLCAAAVLIHPPVAAVPFVAVVCVACPLFASWQLPVAIGAVRRSGPRGHAAAVVRLRRSLDELPETEHPLGY